MTASLPSAAPVDPMNEYRALGRLLLVGVGAGGVIGGFTAGFAFWSPTDRSGFWVAGVVVGLLVGSVCGALAQGLGYALALAAARRRPWLGVTPLRAVLIAWSVTVTTAAAASVAANPDASIARQLAIAGLASGLALAAARLAVDWCLRPLV